MGGWRKSSDSDGNGGSCVEVADDQSAILVRDTTDRDGATITVSRSAWARFTAAIRHSAT
jgi:hypothetical protein